MTQRNKTLAEFRQEILDNIGISYDYYPAYSGADNHCRWQCTDIDCDAAPAFKSFPAFMKHLKREHDISFSILTWMRYFT